MQKVQTKPKLFKNKWFSQKQNAILFSQKMEDITFLTFDFPEKRGPKTLLLSSMQPGIG